jgi:soluble lytic murein transglycosylase-like protein
MNMALREPVAVRRWRGQRLLLMAVVLLIGSHRLYALAASPVQAGRPLPAGEPVPALEPAAAVEAPDGNSPDGEVADGAPVLDRLLEQAADAGERWRLVEAYYRDEVAPIERVLLRYRDDADLARRIAMALVREARRSGLEPRLLLAVLLVENPWLDIRARSPVGARGLMQVMPMHLGKWPPCEPELDDVDANICHGARIFAHYLEAENGNPERALLRYNGCVRGTNTPDCHRYPDHVYARAGRASILAWLGAEPLVLPR